MESTLKLKWKLICSSLITQETVCSGCNQGTTYTDPRDEVNKDVVEVDRSIYHGELLLICFYSFCFLTVFDIHLSFKCLRKFVPVESENKLQTDWSQGSLLQPNYPDLGSDMSSVWNFCTCHQMSFLGNTSSSVVKCGL